MPSALSSHHLLHHQHANHRPRGLWKARVNATPRSTAAGKNGHEWKEQPAFQQRGQPSHPFGHLHQPYQQLQLHPSQKCSEQDIDRRKTPFASICHPSSSSSSEETHPDPETHRRKRRRYNDYYPSSDSSDGTRSTDDERSFGEDDDDSDRADLDENEYSYYRDSYAQILAGQGNLISPPPPSHKPALPDTNPCTPSPRKRESRWTTRAKIMDTTTTAGGGMTELEKEKVNTDDWEDLKELFAKAAEQYETDDVSDALPLLRGVIHECHRFLVTYEDPSDLFTKPHEPPPEPAPLTIVRVGRPLIPIPPSSPKTRPLTKDKLAPPPTNGPTKDKTCTCGDLPTAFHAILGTALFLFGNLIAQEPSLALEGEPNNPVPYWLAALDVFETGDNLPSRTSGKHADLPEDWKMAIVWGRTLVCIADELVAREKKAKEAARTPGSGAATTSLFGLGLSPSSPGHQGVFPKSDEPRWPAESPFSAIAMRRPPVTSRMSLHSATPHDWMMLAMDQFSRGIFRMPHPRHQLAPTPLPSTPLGSTGQPSGGLLITGPLLRFGASTSTSVISSSTLSGPTPTATTGAGAAASESLPPILPSQSETFSRAKELFTIASEVLLLAEKLDDGEQRRYWAMWADSVFNQMKMEGDLDAWRGAINRARGRCWLIAGSANIEELEEAIEAGDTGAFDSEEAIEARDRLGQAIEFFERAKGSATSGAGDGELKELNPLLAEALLSLGNLEKDPRRRREIYARTIGLTDNDLDLMDQDSSEDGHRHTHHSNDTRMEEDHDMEDA